jgi:hypothetical protein
MLMESSFRELDAFGDAVVHLIYPAIKSSGLIDG